MRKRFELQARATLLVALLMSSSALARDADDAGFDRPTLVIVDAEEFQPISAVSYTAEIDTQSYESGMFGYPLGQSLLLQVPVPTAKPVIRASVTKVRRPSLVARKDVAMRVKRVSLANGQARGKVFLPLPIIVGLYR